MRSARLSISLPDDLYLALERRAEQEERTVSNMLARLIRPALMGPAAPASPVPAAPRAFKPQPIPTTRPGDDFMDSPASGPAAQG